MERMDNIPEVIFIPGCLLTVPADVLLPLKEQALGLGIRQTGPVVSHQVFCDKLAVVSCECSVIRRSGSSSELKPDIRMGQSNTCQEAENSILHPLITSHLYFPQKYFFALN